ASSLAGGVLGSPVGYLGPPPSPTSNKMVDRPLANAMTMATAGLPAATALVGDMGATFAEAEGDAVGNPAIQPGATITVSGVPAPFVRPWTVSRARHVFDDSEHGYRTFFAAHGRQDRSVLGLTSKSSSKQSSGATIDGVVCGVVTNCADPLAKGRVKITLPWLSPTFETDWAPNIQFCSGQRTGAMFMPEVGDEVLVAFEFGDPRRPYVLGGMMNNLTKWSVAASGPIMAGGGGMSPDAFGAVMESTAVGKLASGVASGDPEKMAAGAIGSTGMAGSMIVGVSGLGSDSSSNTGLGMGSGSGSSPSGAVMTPGMISEVKHRGYVSTTGNCLVFYDEPMPMVGGLTGGSGMAGGG
ncbi:MAG: phage baseplate assembly protein V, partial [Pseudonocardiaceae bacterium]